jgi:hypothetical protein
VFRPPPPKPAQTSVPRLWQKATRDADALPSVSVLSIHPYPLFRGAHARVPSRPSPGAEKSVASLPHHAARAQRPSTRCACAFVGSGRVGCVRRQTEPAGRGAIKARPHGPASDAAGPAELIKPACPYLTSLAHCGLPASGVTSHHRLSSSISTPPLPLLWTLAVMETDARRPRPASRKKNQKNRSYEHEKRSQPHAASRIVHKHATDGGARRLGGVGHGRSVFCWTVHFVRKSFCAVARAAIDRVENSFSCLRKIENPLSTEAQHQQTPSQPGSTLSLSISSGPGSVYIKMARALP